MGECFVSLSDPVSHTKDTRQTVQTTKAEIISRFGWGLKSTIENHGLSKFKANIERVCRFC
jgi:hypothetical protein